MTSSPEERALPGEKNFYEFERIYRIVARLYGNREAQVLDYGSGSGYGTWFMAEHFGHVWGVDISAEAVEASRARYRRDNLSYSVLPGDLTPPFPDESFDLITSFQVIEHIPVRDLPTVMRQIYGMLKAKGKALITTPNAANYLGNFSGNPYHVKEYTYDELCALCARTLPEGSYSIRGLKDFYSTRLRLIINKHYGWPRLRKLMVDSACPVLAALERRRILNRDYLAMFETKSPRDVIGSFTIDITKRSS